MNSKTLRRLAADHAELHTSLPVNYLFAPAAAHTDDLTRLDVLLAGPTHTPFAAGVWKLHLTIPNNYPQSPPNAILGTKIFHPNVSDNGQICVETIKRDWDSKLTLRDVLVTISCLLIQPNPDSALNAEAGALIQRDYGLFAQRAELMTRIHAAIPASLAAAVREAQNRGQEDNAGSDGESEVHDSMVRLELPARRRRTIAKVRGTRRADTSPGNAPVRRSRQPPTAAPVMAPPPSQPFVRQVGDDDVFGTSRALPIPRPTHDSDSDDADSEMLDADQENDTARSPTKPTTVVATRTPRRPRGAPVPLGELTMPEQDDGDTSSDEMDGEDAMEPEYPPSPRKSPSKSPSKSQSRPAPRYRAESSRDAAAALPPATSGTPSMVTPPNLNQQPLSTTPTMSPPKRPHDRGGRDIFEISKRLEPQQQQHPDSSFMETENSFFHPQTFGTPPPPARGILKTRSPNAAQIRAQEVQKRRELNSKLWEACGKDIRRWNRGDFGAQFLEKKAARW